MRSAASKPTPSSSSRPAAFLGTLELSRTRALGSLVEIECERGAITATPAGDEHDSYAVAFEAQLRAFLDGQPWSRRERTAS